MSKLKVGRQARLLRGVPVNWPKDDTFKAGRVMRVEAYTEDMSSVYLSDLKTPQIHGLQDLPVFRVEDLEPID